MANVCYSYDEIRNQFYLDTGTQSDQSSSLEGELSVATAVDTLMGSAEKKVAVLLYPFWKDGMVPYLNNLQKEKGWSQAVGGTVIEFALPPEGADTNIFYEPISGYINSSDAGSGYTTELAKCELTFVDSTFDRQIRTNPFCFPLVGNTPYEFVPCYFEGNYLKFYRPPRATLAVGQNNIFLKYFRLPKAVVAHSTTIYYSDLHQALKPLTLAFMEAEFYGIDGTDMDLALQDIKSAKASEYFQAAVGKLGFNPYRWNKDKGAK